MSLRMAYGGVLVNERGELLLRQASGGYGGYGWTWPKGGADPGESPEAAALREVLEETGIEAEIVRIVPGAFRGDVTETRLWLMRPLRIAGPPGRETSAIRWVGFEEAAGLIGQTPNPRGRKRDLEILAAARSLIEEGRAG